MPELHVLRVFTGPDGRGGNPLGVFLEGSAVAPERRQATAAELGFSETVFVDDAAGGEIRIFTPTVELPFAGHPTVGTAWLLAREAAPVACLRTPAGEVPVRVEGDVAFAAGRPEWSPPYEWMELASPAEVEELGPPATPAGNGDPARFAWVDHEAGVLRARVFPVSIGIEEDEATGAAAVQLGGLLGRPLEIRQGRGSVIRVMPRGDGLVEVGGAVALDEVRPISG